ncbi:sulfur carrier protein ThiS [Metabacillus herbersteinensis]|uniref:Sulfur carrier protein ThiS n=1 Tax=Metabacillus herbersteinensis TaxID=283816 RepID=A0ABV6GE48_9BACI
MNIRVNGEKIELSSTVKVIEDLLVFFELQERLVIVEQNREIVTKEEYQSTKLGDGDEIELVHFVGGG